MNTDFSSLFESRILCHRPTDGIEHSLEPPKIIPIGIELSLEPLEIVPISSQ